MKIFKRTFFLAGIIAAFFSCSPVQMSGGSGTETVGGCAVDTDSKPVSDIFVKIRKSDFLDTGSISSNKDPDIIIAETKTDNEGKFSVKVGAAGIYALELFDENYNNAALVRCTVNVFDSSYYLKATLKAISNISGKINQISGVEPTKFLVSPYGLEGHSVSTDDSGNFLVPNLPEGDHNINIQPILPIYQSSNIMEIVTIAGEDKELNSIDAQKAQFTIHPGDSAVVRAILDGNWLQAVPVTAIIKKTDASWPYRVTELSIIRVQDNALKFSSLSPRIGELPELRKLSIDSTYIETVPKEIGNLTSLESLELACNTYMDSLPQEIGNLRSLKQMDVHLTPLKTLPSTIGNLQALVEINISQCKFKTIPGDLAGCTHLKFINAFYNEIDSIPLSITTLGDPSLINQFIDFRSNSICRDVQDRIPKAVFEWLDLFSTDSLWRIHSHCEDDYCIPDADK